MDLDANNLSGPWKKEMYADHLPDPAAFDEGFIRSVVEVCQPSTVLDLGCGQGYFVKWLRDEKVEAWGVEGENLGSLFRAPGYQIQQDLSQSFDLGKTYDLVMCTEVVEHIPEIYEDVVFDNIAHHTHRYLVFSGATPGQGGTGHINEKPETYWFACLVRRGFKLLHAASVQTRLSSTLDWYVKNISIWELQKSEEDRLEKVETIAAQYSYHLSQAVSERKMIQAQQQVVDLRSQLHQAHTELHDSKTQLYETQVELHKTQVELHEAKTHLHEVDGQRHQLQVDLHEAKTHLYKVNQQLHQTQVEQHHLKEHLFKAQSELETEKKQVWELGTKAEVLEYRLTRIRLKRRKLRDSLAQSQDEINAMKTSKFWKLRQAWFKLKLGKQE
jgi:SAM-dependent methyltransferase